jgi:2-dehydro-3-deoxygalactonokinase
MTDPCFVAGDWGTSHLRLFLCDADGAALDSAEGPGVARVQRPFAEVFESLVEPWESRHGALPAVLCGMVGSSIGWTQAPYVACPALAETIAGGCISLRAGRVRIVPGVQCKNRLGAPDFMRGEETQILGAAALDGALRRGRHLLCLPGTHTKWVMRREGIIEEFLTAPTGEIFGALRDHSVLVPNGSSNDDVAGSPAFDQALRRFNEFPRVQVLHRLFECRSRLLSGEIAAPDAPAFLSGLLIAADVSAALDLFADSVAEQTVHLIGAARLTQLYAAALKSRSRVARRLDGAAASLAGLVRVHQQSSSPVATHAI